MGKDRLFGATNVRSQIQPSEQIYLLLESKGVKIGCMSHSYRKARQNDYAKSSH